MNSIRSKILMVCLLCINIIPEITNGNDLNKSLEAIAQKEDGITVTSVNSVWDGGSILISCNSGDLKFDIYIQRSQKIRNTPVSPIRVYTIDYSTMPHKKTEILPNSPQEKNLLRIFLKYIEAKGTPNKYKENVEYVIKYILNRELLWDDSVWITPKFDD